MVIRQLKYLLELFMKRKEYLPGSELVSLSDNTWPVQVT